MVEKLSPYRLLRTAPLETSCLSCQLFRADLGRLGLFPSGPTPVCDDVACAISWALHRPTNGLTGPSNRWSFSSGQPSAGRREVAILAWTSRTVVTPAETGWTGEICSSKRAVHVLGPERTGGHSTVSPCGSMNIHTLNAHEHGCQATLWFLAG